ncbi:ATP-binding protein [Marinitenerispora sediminis]|uniref:histidine kinase n=1 Tax=Marinitenerispora sediminis TaxID=1931232 RepID=A0A368T6S3_9ACTN|nr:ATP-binding protein [Marinitenerispora sediminis]RCV55858.1 sensor histidine kinase [Marinitenerispora sediminis]RCV56571.1 sensor histidine kinase [Marinitenerispora sediminis]RCV59409.1 sensor histidine kinase [Marinitenerispora sediminis]
MNSARRGRLRVYLGAAPGVGKTFAALSEAHRRQERGADLVVGYVETYDRPRTTALLGGLEVLPRTVRTHRGARLDELDLDALLDRAPAIAVVDELAHTNVPGSRNAKRWQDVEELLDAGIDVISTLNVQHLESLNDVVEQITGVRQRETIPDDVVRRADQIELCDMSPYGLRRRMSHGNIYPAEKIDAALSNYFREGNLTALRELALLWVADRVDEGLSRYRGEHNIRETWEARERVVVALTGGPEGETLIRRAARIAARSRGGQPQPSQLMAVHVVSSDGLTSAAPEAIADQRRLLAELGGTYHQVLGDDVATALLEFARGVNATQIVLGSSRRPAWQYVFGPGVGATVARESGDVDVHIVTHEEVGRGRGLLPPLTPGGLGPARRTWGWVAAGLGPAALAAVLHLPVLDTLGLTTDMLFFLSATVVVALVGGLWPAMFAAVWGSLLVNYFFTEPLYQLRVYRPANLVALAVSILVGVAVAVVVDLAVRRSKQAARARAEASTLSLLAGSVLGVHEPIPALLRRLCETFGQHSAALLEQGDDGRWRLVEGAGQAPCVDPGEADALVSVSDSLALALRGHVLRAGDRRVLGAFATHIGIAAERQRLARDAAEARRQAAGNKIRTALLAAVSHDLRTPLTSIKASVGSLRATDIELSETDRRELLENIEESTDRLNVLVDNLLDMSRLQTDTVRPNLRAIGLEEVVPATLIGIPGDVAVDVPEGLPRVHADRGLLERAVANVVENAVRHHPADGGPVRVAASALGGTVELRVTDHGPGVPDESKERIFEAFQRLGDAPRGTGIGLGLAVARGFTEAMGGSLTAEDTPGGGLTMVFRLHGLAGAASEREDLHAAAGPE